MRKITLLFVTLLLLSFAFHKVVLAEERDIMERDENPTIDETIGDLDAMPSFKDSLVAGEEIDYQLPYPGILPDHPLYALKLLRDRLLNFLIRDPVKRVEFNLLMSDKRLNMGNYLTEKNNPVLSEEIVADAEKFFEKAIFEMEKAKGQGREIRPELLEKLNLSAAKHLEVVSRLSDVSPENVKEGYNVSLQLISQNQQRLQQLGN